VLKERRGQERLGGKERLGGRERELMELLLWIEEEDCHAMNQDPSEEEGGGEALYSVKGLIKLRRCPRKRIKR
jgi:hypothetical protein